MAFQNLESDVTVKVTSGEAGAVAANLIVIQDSANPGSTKLSTALARGFRGVTRDVTDTLGYTTIRQAGSVQIRVGAGGITAGDYIGSDANGKAATITLPTSITAGAFVLKEYIGKALTTAAAGALVDVLICPGLYAV